MCLCPRSLDPFPKSTRSLFTTLTIHQLERPCRNDRGVNRRSASDSAGRARKCSAFSRAMVSHDRPRVSRHFRLGAVLRLALDRRPDTIPAGVADRQRGLRIAALFRSALLHPRLMGVSGWTAAGDRGGFNLWHRRFGMDHGGRGRRCLHLLVRRRDRLRRRLDTCSACERAA